MAVSSPTNPSIGPGLLTEDEFYEHHLDTYDGLETYRGNQTKEVQDEINEEYSFLAFKDYKDYVTWYGDRWSLLPRNADRFNSPDRYTNAIRASVAKVSPQEPTVASRVDNFKTEMSAFYSKTSDFIGTSLLQDVSWQYGLTGGGELPKFMPDLFAAFLQGVIFPADAGEDAAYPTTIAEENIRAMFADYCGFKGEELTAKTDHAMSIFQNILDNLLDGTTTPPFYDTDGFGKLRTQFGDSDTIEIRTAAPLNEIIPDIKAFAASCLSGNKWAIDDLTELAETAGITASFERQKSLVDDGLKTLTAMATVEDAYDFIANFSGHKASLDYLYGLLGVTTDLIDEASQQMDAVEIIDDDYYTEDRGPGGGGHGVKTRAKPMVKPNGVTQADWDLAIRLAKCQDQTALYQGAKMVGMIGASIAVGIATAAVTANPIVGAASSMAVAAFFSGMDVHDVEERLFTVQGGGTVRRMTGAQLGSEKFETLVNDELHYAQIGAVVNIGLAAFGGYASAKIASAGISRAMQFWSNTGYASLDSLISAMGDGRISSQAYLVEREKMAGGDGSNASATREILIQVTIGTLIGAGMDLTFSGLSSLRSHPDEKLTIIQDIDTKKTRLFREDGTEVPIATKQEPTTSSANPKPAESHIEKTKSSDDVIEEDDVWWGDKEDTTPVVRTDPQTRAVAMPANLSTRLSRLQVGESNIIGANFPIAGITSMPGVSGSHVKITRTTRGFDLGPMDYNTVTIHRENGEVITISNGELTIEKGSVKTVTYESTIRLQDGDIITLGNSTEAPSFVFREPQAPPYVKPHTKDNDIGENGIFDPAPEAITRSSTPREKAYESYVAGRIERLQQVYVKRSSGAPEKGWYVLKVNKEGGTATLVQLPLNLPKITREQFTELLDDVEGLVTKSVPLRDVGFPDDLTSRAPHGATLPDDKALRYVRNMNDYLRSYRTMTRDGFYKLFTGSLKQTRTGNCFLVSALNSLSKSKDAFEVLMRTSITIGDDFYDVRVPLGDPNGKVIRITQADLLSQRNPNFGKVNVDGNVNTREILDPVDGPLGFQILEAAYIKILSGGTMDRSLIDEGGFSLTALRRLLGDDAVRSGRLGNNRGVNSLRSQKDKVESYLANFHNGQDIATLSTKAPNGATDVKTYQVGGHTLYMKHAYSIENVRRHYEGSRCIIDGIVVVNPHDTSQKMLMTLDEFLDAFWMFDAVRIDLGVLFAA